MFLKKVKTFIQYGIKLVFLFFFVMLANLNIGTEQTEIYNDASNRVINLSLMAVRLEDEQKNDLYSPKETYSGDLTGYSADCPLCGGTLACKPTYYIKDGTDTYVDGDYGKVRIVASSTSLPCGSIVRFSSKLSQEPILAIVLDRGVIGRDLDLLTPNEAYATKYVGRSSITYDVLREGWTRS